MDNIDYKILRCLKDNARLTASAWRILDNFTKISVEIGRASCRERV